MKIATPLILALTFLLVASPSAYSETVHQTVNGDSAYTPQGESAVAKKLVEVKDASDGSKMAHVVGSLTQWGFVNYWFGLPAPAGNAVVRFKVFVDGNATATYNIYTNLKSGQTFVAALAIPADAKKGDFVTVDVPVNSPEDWSGLTLKKADSSDKPSPWIDSISIVLP
jgi:hypothetical protein